MNRRIKIDELSHFDAAPYLGTEEAIFAYLNDVMETNDSALLVCALGDVRRAVRLNLANQLNTSGRG